MEPLTGRVTDEGFHCVYGCVAVELVVGAGTVEEDLGLEGASVHVQDGAL